MDHPDFLVHDSTDTVGVIVVEGVEAGQKLTGWVMDTDETITVESLDPISLGHKVALNDAAAAATSPGPGRRPRTSR